MLYLNASATLFSNQAFTMDPHSNTTLWDQTNTPLIYTGFVTVQVTSTSSTTFVELSYSAYGVVYDNAVKVGTAGTASFPVLPGPATISLGNTEANSTVTGNVSATYTY